MRFDIADLQGAGITTYRIYGGMPRWETRDSHVLAITMEDAEGTKYLLVTNSSRETSYNVTADLSALITNGTGTMWQFDATHNDVIVGHPTLSHGHVTCTIPATAAILITF